jgi:PKD repeat protein
MHTFRHAGSWQINVTMVGARRSTLDTVSSYITVQEPVTGLQLLGPKVLAYQE